GSGTDLQPIGNSNPSNRTIPGYKPGLPVFAGYEAYDPLSHRLIHANGNDGGTFAFQVGDVGFTPQESSSTFGGVTTAVLSTDFQFFYYGARQVDAHDLTHHLRTFSENILASTALVAFGDEGAYSSAPTGTLLGNIGFKPKAIALDPTGNDFWAYDPATSTLHYFLPEAPVSWLLALAIGALSAAYCRDIAARALA